MGQGKFLRYVQPDPGRTAAAAEYERKIMQQAQEELLQQARVWESQAWGQSTLERMRQYEDKGRQVKEQAGELKGRLDALEREAARLRKAEEEEKLRQGGYRKADLWDSTVNSFWQGDNTAQLGKEYYLDMLGKDSRSGEYEEKLAGEEYRFVPQGWKRGVSGFVSGLGEDLNHASDLATQGLMGGYGVLAYKAGQLGPLVALSEEAITIPGAMMLGYEQGKVLSKMKSSAGLAYRELLQNGVSEETARTIAAAAGGANSFLEVVPVGDLLRSLGKLSRKGVSDPVKDILIEELKKRGVDIGWDTLQGVAQEGVNIAGVQAGSMLDTGQWAYDAKDVADRLKDKGMDALLSSGIRNLPGAVGNITSRINAAGGVKTVSDSVAAGLLRDRRTVEFLSRRGGLNLTPGMTAAEQVAAVRAAVGNILQRKSSRPQDGGG